MVFLVVEVPDLAEGVAELLVSADPSVKAISGRMGRKFWRIEMRNMRFWIGFD